jgi:hypothetical protein
MKKLWLIWARTVDHRVGKTDDDQPDIPILTQNQARISLLFRSFIILLNVVTCGFIIANAIRHW